MATKTIYYDGSANKKNPTNLMNWWNEPFVGTVPEAKKRARVEKKKLVEHGFLSGRVKVTIKSL